MRFRRAWRWPEQLESLVERFCRGYTVHVCCGESQLGHLRIDRYTRADVKGDAWALPLGDNVADTTVCDPPFNIAYTRRHLLTYELRRITKVGGLLVFKAPWVPRAPRLKEVEYWILVPTNPTENVSILSILRKKREVRRRLSQPQP